MYWTSSSKQNSRFHLPAITRYASVTHHKLHKTLYSSSLVMGTSLKNSIMVKYIQKMSVKFKNN